MTTPSPSKEPEPSLLAQTFEIISKAGAKLLPAPPDYSMWTAAAWLTMSEYRVARRLKAEWVSGARWG